MKIAMIGTKGVPTRYGGVETHVDALGTHLVRRGHEVLVYVRAWYAGKNAPSRYNGMRLITVPTIHTKHLDAAVHTLFATLHALFVERPDIYHFHCVGPALFAWLPRIFAPHARTVVTIHSLDRTHGKWGAFARLMLRLGEWAAVTFAHKTLVVSPLLKTYAKEHLRAETTYIPNGITPRRTSLNPAVLDAFNLTPTKYVLMVGRLLPIKSAHTLIAAWKIAKERYPERMRGMKLALVGDSVHTDEYVRTLHSMAANDTSIVFTGFQSGAPLEALFMGAAFVAHPSEREGLSLVILEAMSYGKAVVASDIPENIHLVRESGIAVPVKNADAWAEALADMLANPSYALALGVMGRTIVETQYNWEDIAEKTAMTYRNTYQLLASGKKYVQKIAW